MCGRGTHRLVLVPLDEREEVGIPRHIVWFAGNLTHPVDHGVGVACRGRGAGDTERHLVPELRPSLLKRPELPRRLLPVRRSAPLLMRREPDHLHHVIRVVVVPTQLRRSSPDVLGTPVVYRARGVRVPEPPTVPVLHDEVVAAHLAHAVLAHERLSAAHPEERDRRAVRRWIEQPRPELRDRRPLVDLEGEVRGLGDAVWWELAAPELTG